MECGRDLDQDAGATVLFARKLVQAKSFEAGTKLGREDRDLGQIAVIEVIPWRGPQKCDGTDDFPGDQQR